MSFSGGTESSLSKLPKVFLCNGEAKPKMLAGRERPAYKHPQHKQKAFEALSSMRKQNVLCDVTLVAGDIECPAHKALLASCSQYFFAMFTGEMTEAKLDRIILQEIDSKALQLLVDFVYTSEIHVTEENVQTLLPAANLLQLTAVQEACCDFLQSQLHPSNCLGIQAFADLHACAELHSHAQTFVEQHFSEVVHYDEFLSLPERDVCNLISNDCLTVTTEEQVFEAVVSWIQHDLANRQESCSQLIERVRLPLMTQEYLVQRVEEEPLVKANSQCKDFLIEALKFHLLKPEQKSMYKTPRTVPRTPIGLPRILLVIGGQAPKAIRSVECYDFKEERWYQLAEMPSRRCRCGPSLAKLHPHFTCVCVGIDQSLNSQFQETYTGVAVVNGLVYAVGGFNGSLRIRTVDVYDPIKDTWMSCPSMEARRSTLGVAVLNGVIYAIGGFDGSSGLDSAECFDIKFGDWKMIACMRTRRSSVGVGVVGGKLYAVGGYDGASRQCLSTVECYDPISDTWCLVSDMSCRRSGAGVGVIDGTLYAVGGHDGPLVRRSIEMYNPETNKWSPAADMHLCRRNAGIVANNGMLFVVGGDDGSSNLGSVECYDTKTNVWTMLSSSMMTGRSYSGVAIIDKPVW